MFTARQLTALDCLAGLVDDTRAVVEVDALSAGLERGQALRDGGKGARAYAEAVAVYLGIAVSKTANRGTSLAPWMLSVECPADLFKRSAISMTLDFAEANILDGPSGSFLSMADNTAKGIEALTPTALVQGVAVGADAMSDTTYAQGSVVSTDPPYYDNIPYADLSDFFYVWLRRSLRSILPDVFPTMLVPKQTELIAEPFRHGGRDEAEDFFLRGMRRALSHMAATVAPEFPTTIYYAFKQSEATSPNLSHSTGWETFLTATIEAGFEIVGTWPVRTEREARARAMSSNALASSIVLVCRRRTGTGSVVTAARFRRLLRAELPGSLRALEGANIAPVDMAQATIGPGMAIYSRHARVLEADDAPMSVPAALRIIHEVIDEIRGEDEADLDLDTRFAVTWFESFGFDQGPYGDAETLAKARNVSVAGFVESGIGWSSAGRVRLLRRAELPDGWYPGADDRVTVWEITQHLIKRLVDEGEDAAAHLLAQIQSDDRLSSLTDSGKTLAYRLFAMCERKGWSDEARAYNLLVVAWPELLRLAASSAPHTPRQTEIF